MAETISAKDIKVEIKKEEAAPVRKIEEKDPIFGEEELEKVSYFHRFVSFELI